MALKNSSFWWSIVLIAVVRKTFKGRHSHCVRVSEQTSRADINNFVVARIYDLSLTEKQTAIDCATSCELDCQPILEASIRKCWVNTHKSALKLQLHLRGWARRQLEADHGRINHWFISRNGRCVLAHLGCCFLTRVPMHLILHWKWRSVSFCVQKQNWFQNCMRASTREWDCSSIAKIKQELLEKAEI